MRRYVATVQLKRVTDGERTFWHWESTFEPPRGREREFADLVGKGVYEGGFDGLARVPAARRARRRVRRAPSARSAAGARHRRLALRWPRGADARSARRAAPRRRAKCASGTRRSASTSSTSTCAPGATACSSRPRRRAWRPRASSSTSATASRTCCRAIASRTSCPPPGAYVDVRTLAAATRRRAARRRRRRDRRDADAQGHDAPSTCCIARIACAPATRCSCMPRPAASARSCARGRKALGARVIGTVSSDEKARVAREQGCDVAIVTRDAALRRRGAARRPAAAAPTSSTTGSAAPAHDENLRALATLRPLDRARPGGRRACAARHAARCRAKSATVSRPVLFHYTAARERFEAMAAQHCSRRSAAASLRPEVRHRYAAGGRGATRIAISKRGARPASCYCCPNRPAMPLRLLRPRCRPRAQAIYRTERRDRRARSSPQRRRGAAPSRCAAIRAGLVARPSRRPSQSSALPGAVDALAAAIDVPPVRRASCSRGGPPTTTASCTDCTSRTRSAARRASPCGCARRRSSRSSRSSRSCAPSCTSSLHHLDYELFALDGDVPHRRLLQARVEPRQRAVRRKRIRPGAAGRSSGSRASRNRAG